MSKHSIVHIEFPAHDPKAAGDFYANLFGWKLHLVEAMNYHMFMAEPGPGGAFVQTCEDNKPGDVRVYVSTDDIDATLAQAEKLGGKMLVPKTEIPNAGWFAIFTDPTGNQVALFTDAGHGQ